MLSLFLFFSPDVFTFHIENAGAPNPSYLHSRDVSPGSCRFFVSLRPAKNAKWRAVT